MKTRPIQPPTATPPTRHGARLIVSVNAKQDMQPNAPVFGRRHLNAGVSGCTTDTKIITELANSVIIFRPAKEHFRDLQGESPHASLPRSRQRSERRARFDRDRRLW
jgi:hypothetical protein